MRKTTLTISVYRSSPKITEYSKVFCGIMANVTESNVTVSNEKVLNVTVSNLTNSFNAPIDTEKASIALIISVYFVCCWVLVTNSLVLMCVVFNRRAVKTFINLQILSLSITDFLEGLSFIPVVMMFQNPAALLTFWSCAVFLYSYLTAQFASILHALSICIYRLLTLMRRRGNSEISPFGMYKKLFIQVAALWVGCLVFVLIVFVSFGKYRDSNIRTCSLDELFQQNYSFSITILNTMRVIPHVTTNVIYVYILILLSKIWKRVNVIRQEPVTATGPTSGPDTSKGMIFLTTVENAENSRNEGNLSGKYVYDTHNLKDKRHAYTQTIKRNTSNAYIKEQKGVVITIGILLLGLNIFMTPVLVIPLVNIHTDSMLSGSTKLIMALFPLLNSMINPLVYIFRIRSFRNILRQACGKTCPKFGCKL